MGTSRSDSIRTTDHLDRIARTLLYEGYLLWPYRRSSLKNQRRWTIGGVFPEGSGEDTRSGDPRVMHLETLVEGDDGPEIDIRIRFLHRVVRQAARWDGTALEPVDELRVGGELYLTWDEAVEREVRVRVRVGEGGLGVRIVRVEPIGGGVGVEGVEGPGGAGSAGSAGSAGTESGFSAATCQHALPINIPAGTNEDWLEDTEGERAGALIRSWDALQGRLELDARRAGERLVQMTVRLVNTASATGADRDTMLGRTFLSAHIILQSTEGEFVSLLDPRASLAEVAASCENRRCWPVLVGDPGDRHTILASPMILYDYPQIAPESAGDLFDGTEIDKLLILNILGMTEAEKVEMRASDPHAKEILDRAEALGAEQLLEMMGAIREFRVLEGEPVEPAIVERSVHG
jgi:hypothetical protein